MRLLAMAAAVALGAAIMGGALALFAGEATSANTVTAEGQHDIRIADQGEALTGTTANGALDVNIPDAATETLAGGIDVRNANTADGFRYSIANVSTPTPNAEGNAAEQLAADITVTTARRHADDFARACATTPDGTPPSGTAVQTVLQADAAFHGTWVAAGVTTDLAAVTNVGLCFYVTTTERPLGGSPSVTSDVTITAVDQP